MNNIPKSYFIHGVLEETESCGGRGMTLYLLCGIIIGVVIGWKLERRK